MRLLDLLLGSVDLAGAYVLDGSLIFFCRLQYGTATSLSPDGTILRNPWTQG